MLAESEINNYRVIACGGDGTAAWLLQALDETKPKYNPPVRPSLKKPYLSS